MLASANRVNPEANPQAHRPPRRRHRALRGALFGLGGVVALLVLVVGVLRWRLHGAGLATTIEGLINDKIRGRVDVGSVEWPLEALPTTVTGGWVPFVVRDVRVFDERGVKVIDAPLATGELDAHALMFGDHRFVFRKLRIPSGGYAPHRGSHGAGRQPRARSGLHQLGVGVPW